MKRLDGRERVTAVVVAVVTLIDYLAWLGWDQHKKVSADGRVTGTYHAWQLIGLAVVLALVADWAGKRTHDQVAAVTAAIVIGLAVAVDSDSHQDGYFVIGAAAAGFATFLGVRAMAWVGREFDNGRWNRLRDYVARRAHLSHR